jgi:membrane protein implicated in regulation of membrane protease activity
MPLDKLVLILVTVIAAAGITVWVGTLAAAALQVPQVGWLVAVPALLVGYVVWRVVADRLNNREDDHYDRIEK